MNIYEGCLQNSDVFYRTYDTDWNSQLDKKKEYYESNGYKVVFIVHQNSFQDAARAVIYDKETHISQYMQDYRHKYVKLNGIWMNEGLLGICDKCGEYKELICLCKEGNLCAQCDQKDN